MNPVDRRIREKAAEVEKVAEVQAELDRQVMQYRDKAGFTSPLGTGESSRQHKNWNNNQWNNDWNNR